MPLYTHVATCMTLLHWIGFAANNIISLCYVRWIHKSSRNHVELHHNNTRLSTVVIIILLLTTVIFLARDQKSLMLLYSAIEQLCAVLS